MWFFGVNLIALQDCRRFIDQRLLFKPQNGNLELYVTWRHLYVDLYFKLSAIRINSYTWAQFSCWNYTPLLAWETSQGVLHHQYVIYRAGPKEGLGLLEQQLDIKWIYVKKHSKNHYKDDSTITCCWLFGVQYLVRDTDSFFMSSN